MLQQLLLKFCVFESWVFGFSCCLECLDVQWFADGRTIRRLSRSPPSMSMTAWHVLWPSTFDVENRICHKPDDVTMIFCWYDINMYLCVCVGIDLILYLDFILVCKMFNLALAIQLSIWHFARTVLACEFVIHQKSLGLATVSEGLLFSTGVCKKIPFGQSLKVQILKLPCKRFI